MDEWIIYTLLLILINIIILVILKSIGAFKEKKVSLWGPFLMWRTEKGKKLIEKLARPKRIWRWYGNVSVAICLVTMILMMVFLIWTTTLVSRIPRESAPSPQLLLGIPGVNPIIPLWYGILALAVAIIIHEFAHGILSRVGKLKLKSLGIIYFLFPWGAFVEPDEEELRTTTKKKRMRIFAAGPSTNIIFAIICALIFSWGFIGSISPVTEGVFISGALADSPAHEAGLSKMWMEIVEINDTPIKDIEDFENVPAPKPLENTTVKYFYEGNFRTVNVTSGVVILHVSEDYPADDAGVESGMILLEINGTEIRNDGDFQDAMKLTRPNQNVNITLYEYNETTDSYTLFNTTVTLEDKYEYYEEHYPQVNKESFRNVGFLGVSHGYLGLKPGGNPKALADMLSHPFSNVDSMDEATYNMLIYILLPFQGLSPFPEPMTELYEVTGPLAVLPSGVFWTLANIFYWLFWLNLMVGWTNTLPAVPLDGGHLFKDSLDGIISKIKRQLDKETRERYVAAITYSLALLVLVMILYPLIGPRL
ncbi:MAG: site-2 protease family protein [Thermoplasmata archaeon]|nr:MAG: site-2 protease family protein [Thermoplasmata archaeon]